MNRKKLAIMALRPGTRIFIPLFIILAAGFIWSYLGYQDAKKQINFLSSSEGQAQVARLEVDALLAKVGGLILLPEGEKPAVATIQDIEALVEQEAFYKGAKNGDKVIVYRERAIIYDPVNNKLINVGPVYFQEEPIPVRLDSEPEEAFEPAEVVTGEEFIEEEVDLESEIEELNEE